MIWPSFLASKLAMTKWQQFSYCPASSSSGPLYTEETTMDTILTVGVSVSQPLKRVVLITPTEWFGSIKSKSVAHSFFSSRSWIGIPLNTLHGSIFQWGRMEGWIPPTVDGNMVGGLGLNILLDWL